MTNLRLDLRSRYSLLQAFDEVGRTLFPNEWHGEEAWAKPARTDLEEIPQRRDEAKKRLTNVLKQILQINAAFDASESDAERNALSSLLPDLYHERDDLNKTINSLPDPSQGDIEDGMIFARRSEVEQKLSAAFDAGDLRILFGRNSILLWKDFCRDGDLAINYTLSTVTLPPDRAQEGTHPAFIERKRLDSWIDLTFERQVSGEIDISPEELARQWLEGQVQTLRPREKTKSIIKAEAMEKFPTLTTRRFEQIWANTVPDSWKKAGRRAD